jgi:hypothetical protein
VVLAQLLLLRAVNLGTAAAAAAAAAAEEQPVMQQITQ